ncbi:hypothetical protein AAIH73_34990, partial [Pseudomonas aeruginosa]|uniref:hypothetical protein n=1 Tax=Pseudomonas aeruginosa TaxID=287 RepID=UPI0031B67CBF
MIITDTRESHWSIEGLVKEHSQVLDLLQQITDPGSPKGALVVVGGVIGVGKSTTLHRLLAYLAGAEDKTQQEQAGGADHDRG